MMAGELDLTNGNRPSPVATLSLIAAASLTMGMGWGVRGAYGHCTGAMMPGAMLGLVLAACARREDWWKRCALLGMLGAIGFAWGGQASYGILIGYTPGDSVSNSGYGYATLFLVGALYGSLGGGFLGLGLTQPRSFFAQFALPLTAIYLAWWEISRWGPLSQSVARYFGYYDPETQVTVFAKGLSLYVQGQWLYDTPWVWGAVALPIAALFWLVVPRTRSACNLIMLMICAWFFGMLILVHVAKLRINPPRSESWAGCVGVLVAFVAWLSARRNRASLMLLCYGGIAGGVGFAIGTFFQMLGKAKWGPIDRYAFLQQFNYWTVMEQTLGLAMGLGVAIGFCRLIRGRLAPPDEDDDRGWTNEFAILLMLGPMLWDNLVRNSGEWIKNGKFNRRGDDPFPDFGVSAETWLMLLSALLTGILIYGMIRNRRHPLPMLPATWAGRSQLFALFLMWLILGIYFTLNTVHVANMSMFTISATVASLIVLSIPSTGIVPEPASSVSPEASQWLPGMRHWLLWFIAPFLLWGLARATVELDLKPIHTRFESKSNEK